MKSEKYKICEEHSKDMELYCLDCLKFICVKCLLSEGHQVHRIQDCQTAFNFLSKDFEKKLSNIGNLVGLLENSVGIAEQRLAFQKEKQEKLKNDVNSVYKELKQSLKRRKNKILQSSKDVIEKNQKKVEEFQKNVKKVKSKIKKWLGTQNKFDQIGQESTQMKLGFMNSYSKKTIEMEKESEKINRRISEGEEQILDKFRFTHDKENLKINMLNYAQSKVLKQMPLKKITQLAGGSQKTTKGIKTRTGRKLKVKTAFDSRVARGSHLDYKSSDVRSQNLGDISKNLKCLQKGLNSDHLQNYQSINSRISQLTSTFQRPKGSNLRKKLSIMNSKKKSDSRAPSNSRSSVKKKEKADNYSSSNGRTRFSKKKYSNSNFKTSFNQKNVFCSPSNKTVKNNKKLVNLKKDLAKEIEVLELKKEEPLERMQVDPSEEENHLLQTEFSLSIHENEEISIQSIKKNQILV